MSGSVNTSLHKKLRKRTVALQGHLKTYSTLDLPLFMAGVVLKAGSGDKTLLRLMQLSLFSMFGIINFWRW